VDLGLTPAVDPGQQPRLALGPRRPHHARHRDRRQARRHHDPEGRGRRGHPLRRPAARPARGRAGLDRPILLHAILETARGVANVEEICAGLAPHAGPLARPRRPRREPAHEDHPRRRRPPRLPRPPGPRRTATSRPTAPPTSRTCGTTRSPGWSTPARPTGSCRTTARSATSRTPSPARTSSATPTCSAASGRGACTRCRSTSPRRCSPPRSDEVAWAKRVVEAMGDGTGAVMIDGKMQDDATYKQCQVVLDLAKQLAERDPELKPRPTTSEGLMRHRRRPACAPPERPLHARRQRARAREGQGPRRRRADPRPRGRRRPDAKAEAASASAPPPRASTAARDHHPRQRPRHRLARRRRRAIAAAVPTPSWSRRSTRSTTCTPSRTRSSAAARRTTPASGRWSRRRSRCSTPRRSPASERLTVLVMGTNDLAKELHAEHVPGRQPLLTGLGLCLLAARATGKVILDGVYNDLDDAEGFEAECRQGRQMGFDGKTLIHPKQLEPCNRIFAPSDDEVERARDHRRLRGGRARGAGRRHGRRPHDREPPRRRGPTGARPGRRDRRRGIRLTADQAGLSRTGHIGH
jgi:citrate lyase beta subunit